MTTLSTHSRTKLACAVALFLLAPASIHAATETWDGGHGSANAWFANLNWADDSAPADLDDLVFTGTTRLNHSSWADMGGGDNDFDINSITFDSAAGAFVIANGGGPPGSVIKMHGDITNDDADLQTMNFNFQLNNNIGIRTNSGDITIGGVISEDGSSRKITQFGGSGTLTLTKANTFTGGVSIGSLSEATAGGTINITNSSALGTGMVTFEQGGTLELGTSGLNVANNIFIPNWSGSINTIRLDEAGSAIGTLSGNVQIHDGTASGFQVDVGTDDTLDMSGKFFRTAGGGTGITKIGDGTLILSGDSSTGLPAGTDAIGNINVNDGTLLVNGATGTTGSLIVNNGGTLGGTGTVKRATTLNDGGFLSAGVDGIGTLNFSQTIDVSGAAAASLLFDLGQGFGSTGTGDLLDIGGNLNLDGLDISDFSFTDLGALTSARGEYTWTLFSAASTSGSFTASSGAVFDAYPSYFTGELSLVGADVLLTMFVPEPSSTALLGLGLSSLLLRRKRS